MDEIDPQAAVAEPEDTTEEETPEAELTDDTDWKAEAIKARRMASRYRNQAVKAKEVKVEKPAESKPEAAIPSQEAGKLDQNALDYLDAKGITEQEDIDIIEAVAKRTGKTAGEALKDDYVVSKLSANKQKREVQNATPSSTRRSGQAQTDSVEHALAEYERSGKLPDSFELRTKVVEAKAAKQSDTVPPWRR
jgi:hypothetical protein